MTPILRPDTEKQGPRRCEWRWKGTCAAKSADRGAIGDTDHQCRRELHHEEDYYVCRCGEAQSVITNSDGLGQPPFYHEGGGNIALMSS